MAELFADPVGDRIEVYVNPDYPTDATIQPGGDPAFLFLMFSLASLPIIVGIAMILIS
jgi:hypothetical protein